MEAAQLYESYKSLLFSLAYRMLGSVMDSEDIVHDVFLDWERKNAGNQLSQEVSHVKAYLCKMVTNRCIDLLRSSKRQREQYFGAWLPEPLVGGRGTDEAALAREGADPLQRLVQRDSLSVAYLVMLEKLSPLERAVFLLREVFAYSFEEIAPMVDKKPNNCRQILSRAKKKLDTYEQSAIYRPGQTHHSRSGHSEEDSASAANEAVLTQFVQYVAQGNVDGLMRIMVGNAVFTSDGGGKVQAAVHPVLGRDRVIRLLLGIASKPVSTELAIELAMVNSEPGIIIFAGDIPYCTMAFAYEDGKVAAIYNTMNPDKLRHVRR